MRAVEITGTQDCQDMFFTKVYKSLTTAYTYICTGVYKKI